MKDTGINGEAARAVFLMILEKMELKPITDGNSERREGKDNGKPGSWNSLRSLST